MPMQPVKNSGRHSADGERDNDAVDPRHTSSESTISRSISAQRRFLYWAADYLRIPVEQISDYQYRLDLPESARGDFDGLEHIYVSTGSPPPKKIEAAETLDAIQPQDRIWTWLVDRVNSLGSASHAQPKFQTRSVHSVTDRIFSAYEVEGGNVRLAGCTLEDRPVFWLLMPHDESGVAGWTEAFLHEDGRPLDLQEIGSLGLDEPIAYRTPPKHTTATILKQMDSAMAASGLNGSELLAMVVVWCKFAEGKLRFQIGQHSAYLAFSGWASTLAAPPFRCPHTGASSFHVAATDDGRITVQDELGECEFSRQKALRTELITCAVTGQHVLGEFVERCPVTGEYVLSEQMATCSMCLERVSPHAISRRKCAACRRLSQLSHDDPRNEKLRAELPVMDSWRGWSISETERVYILHASNWRRQLLIVVDKESLKPIRVATRSRISPTWNEQDIDTLNLAKQ